MKRAVIAAVGFIALGGTNAFASPAFASTTDVTELLATARVTGGVRVIVQVRVADGADAAAIAAAQDAVLAELASTPYQLGRRYTTIPYLSVFATEPALRVLGDSPNVVSVREDLVLKPQPLTLPAR